MKICYPQCVNCSETVPALLGSTVVCPMCGEHISTEGMSGEFFTPELAVENSDEVVYQRIGTALARFFIPMLIFACLCGVLTGVLINQDAGEVAEWVGTISMFILLPIHTLADCSFNRNLVWCPLRAAALQLIEGLSIWITVSFKADALELTLVNTSIAWLGAGVLCLLARVLFKG